MTEVEVVNLVKVYDRFTAVNGVSFKVSSGEFFGLLGPSGCGKTTTLYCISGLETPTDGKILFNGRDVTKLPTQQRNIGMVFQSYAIFFNMNVYDNLAYPLKLRKYPKSEIAKKVKETAELLGLGDILNVKGGKLTPAQMQLVSLGRAIIYNPSILLLDEPLSNLDPTFRMETLRHIKRIQRLLNITAIFVTHDQLEALSVCDKIAVMQSGKIVQIGTPEEVYYRPSSVFVASFVGTPPMNLINGVVERRDGKTVIQAPELVRPFPVSLDQLPDDKVIIGFRSEDVEVLPTKDVEVDGLLMTGVIKTVERTALENIFLVDSGGKTVKVVSERELRPNTSVYLHVPSRRVYIYSQKDGNILKAASLAVKNV
ncbi:sn-glycerol-3-phosphate import ATP-binding protein UgpC [archaeon HR01]|nr:sn-glycerol-3-phosphate import ATP-binding protein UgpC [archaeon HR01]